MSAAAGASGLLAGKVAVISGASRGIGRAIAGRFVAEGARVAGCSVSGPFDQAGLGVGFLADLPPADRVRGLLAACDVRDAAEVARFRDLVLQRFGVPDIICNNAGTVVREAFVALDKAQWDEVLGSNLTGTFHFTQAFLPSMLDRQVPARIINIASIAGRQGTPFLTAYCAAKHGVVGLTRALAEELRSSKITVNAICPGSVDTDMLKIGMPGGVPAMGPAAVADVAMFLAADAPSAMTGACLDVFG